MATEKICPITNEVFVITDDDLEFYNKLEIPAPTICPQERLRRRLSYRNFRHLYHRNCDKSGAKIISMYDSAQPFPVYSPAAWWSDDWNALDYGTDYDPSKSFFEQYRQLAAQVPRAGIMILNSENCDYSNMGNGSRDCYLVFGCVNNDSCLYGHIVWDSEHCVDCLYAYRSQWCSNSVDIVDCYSTHYSIESYNCSDSFFLRDCRGCKNCFYCSNLRNAEYCWANEQLTKEQYQRRLAELTPFSAETVASHWEGISSGEAAAVFYPPCYGTKFENCTGNHLYDSANLVNCFDCKSCEDCKHSHTVIGANNCYDLTFTGLSMRYSVECLTCPGCDETFYSHLCDACHQVYYSEFCVHSNNLFGCNGLRRKSHCILNKQYSEQDYHELKQKIIADMTASGEWGEYFPIAHSPFAYNESIVNEYLPLSAEQAATFGASWREEQVPERQASPQLTPQTIDKASDSTLDKVFHCEQTHKPYRIIAQELEFYRRVGLPLPRLSPDARHLQRMALRGPRELYAAVCPDSGEALKAAFDPAQGCTVYSEAAYLSHLY